MVKFILDDDQLVEIRKRNKRIDKLMDRVQKARQVGGGITLTKGELEMMVVQKKGREYVEYQQNDSPKGESVPGVRFKIAA